VRIPFPDRIPYAGATAFAATLLVVQLVERTDFYVALCCFAYIMVSTAAFNIAGGISRTAGAYIFFYATLTGVVGICTKAVLGEPANSNLVAPLRTFEVYLLGMVAMLIAAYIESRFRRQRPLIALLFPADNLRSIYIGAAVIGVTAQVYYNFFLSNENGSFATAFHNADNFIPFALVMGVIYTVRSSNGRRSMTPGLGILFLMVFLEGVFTFSKQAMFLPPFCWVVGAAISRYNLRPFNIATLALTVYILAAYMTPFSQYGRLYGAGNAILNAPIAISMLMDINDIRKKNDESSTIDYGKLNYYNQPEGIFDRLSMIGPDDLLIDVTDRQGLFGYEPTKEGFENLIPHFIWPDKPVPYFGNLYAHEMGTLSPEDFTTGIAFGISADAYHQGGVFGILFVMTFCLTVVFVISSALLGSVRDHLAVIVSVLYVAHIAPEDAIPGLIILILNALVILGLAFGCKYILPVVASVFEPKKPKASFVRPALAAG